MNTTNEIPTPRTDALKDKHGNLMTFNEMLSFAKDQTLLSQTLERELAEARESEASETRWAEQYKRERDEAIEQRDRLVEALRSCLDQSWNGPLPDKWREVAAEALAAVKGVKQCGTCDGSGAVDSGGFTPWGEGIDIQCPECAMKGGER